MFDVVEILELNRKAAGADLHFASDDELLAGAKAMVAATAMAEAAQLHLLAELDERQVCDHEFGSTTATWLAQETRADRGALAARVNMAEKLRRPFGAIDAALSDGVISVDHARAFARAANPRVAEELAAEQDVWIARAQDRPFRVWKHELEARAELLDQDGPFDPNQALARNKMSMQRSGDDGVVFRGELHGEFAIGFRQRIEARAEQLWDRAKADHAACPEIEVPPYNTLVALACEELTRHGSAAASGSAPPVDLTLVHRDDDPDMITTPDEDVRLPAEWLAHLLCDAQLTLLTTNVVGVLVNLGRTARLASRAQRRALAIRDGGCVFPGCSAPVRWCDAHHVHHWERGGSTDLCNMALLCRHHHGVTHRRGWSMTVTDDERFVWTTPGGQTLHSQRHGGRPPPGS